MNTRLSSLSVRPEIRDTRQVPGRTPPIAIFWHSFSIASYVQNPEGGRSHELISLAA